MLHKFRVLAGTAAWLAMAGTAIGAPDRQEPIIAVEPASITYPRTDRGDVVDLLFGEKIADPYRWLENNVRADEQVAAWVEGQNSFTRRYLDMLPQRAWFEQRIRALLDYERFGLPVKAGGRYFYERNPGLLNQAQLYMRKGLNGRPVLLLDPNSWAADGATALDAWKPSDDGRYLLYSVLDGGSDWRVLRVLDVASGKTLDDEIRWAKFTDLAWVGNSGFLYSRFPEPEEGAAFQGLNYNHAVYFHRLGTPQSEDELVYATPAHPEYNHTAQVTHDGRLALITTAIGTDARYELHVINLDRREKRWQARPLITGFEHDWRLVEGMRGTLWFVTNWQAPRYRLVAIDLDKRKPEWRQLVPEQTDILQQATIIGNQLILSYLHDASTRALIFDLNGKSVRELSLSGIGTAAGFRGKPGDPETFYSFTSFNFPSAIYRMQLEAGHSEPFAQPELAFDPREYAVEQRFYTSKDGTRVPMFIVRKQAIAKAGEPVPTLLYGYGGFDIALTPGFSSIRMAWLEAGGAFALVNLRGGGEYGKDWHDAGRLDNKQNVFDDFIAAAEYLIAEGVTPAGGLAIQGRSNGGLLVGAVVNQRPDLFAAANPAVGVMDMLRFDKFTAGRYWVDDYGRPDREEDFRNLLAYSPYHNIRRGVDYPAIIVTTADTDDRVVPGHSFKYAAALQAAGLGSRPQIIRIETRAGHGAGTPTDKMIEEGADIMAFLAHWTGLRVPEEPSAGIAGASAHATGVTHHRK